MPSNWHLYFRSKKWSAENLTCVMKMHLFFLNTGYWSDFELFIRAWFILKENGSVMVLLIKMSWFSSETTDQSFNLTYFLQQTASSHLANLPPSYQQPNDSPRPTFFNPTLTLKRIPWVFSDTDVIHKSPPHSLFS